MDVQIRRARPGDAFQLAALLHSIGWFSAIQGLSLEALAEQVALYLQLDLSGESHTVYIAEVEQANPAGSQIVGYTAVHWLPYLFLNGPEGYVSELFVDEESRGQGVGGKLLEAVKAEAKERGCSRLSLLNSRQRESYQRGFYQKQGWEERPDMMNFIYRLKGRKT